MLEAQDLVFVIWRIENYFIYLWVQLTSKSGHPIKVFSHLLMKMVTLWGFYLYVRFRIILSVGTPHRRLLLCIRMHYLEIKVLWQIKMPNPCLVGVNMIPANLWYPDDRSNVLHRDILYLIHHCLCKNHAHIYVVSLPYLGIVGVNPISNVWAGLSFYVASEVNITTYNCSHLCLV